MSVQRQSGSVADVRRRRILLVLAIGILGPVLLASTAHATAAPDGCGN